MKAEITGKERTQIKNNIRKHREYDSARFGEQIQADEELRTLTYEEYLEIYIEQEGKCFYTGLPMVIGKKQMNSASLDRMDSSQPHTKWNCVLCALEVNFSKNNFDMDEYLKYRYDNGYPLSDGMRAYVEALRATVH